MSDADHTLYTLGRLHVPDDRDNNFSMALRGAALRSEARFEGRSWAHWHHGDILDQGNDPHCVAFSWKQFLQTAPMCQGRNLRENFIYELCQQRDQWPGESYDGTSVRAGAKVLHRLGFIEAYLWAHTVDEMENWLKTQGPIVLGTIWYSDMFSPKGATAKVTATGSIAGGHAYLCIGCSSKKRVFRCVNSWGEGWGNDGRFEIPYKDMSVLLNKQGEACLPTEQKIR